MIFNWYRIFNLTEFLSTELVSVTYELELENLGIKKVLVTQGNEIGVTYDDTMLVVPDEADEIFTFNGKAVYWSSTTDDVYLGLPV